MGFTFIKSRVSKLSKSGALYLTTIGSRHLNSFPALNNITAHGSLSYAPCCHGLGNVEDSKVFSNENFKMRTFCSTSSGSTDATGLFHEAIGDASSWWRWLKNLSFIILFTVLFGRVHLVPISNRPHLALCLCSDEFDNFMGSLVWGRKARKHCKNGRILSPTTPESIRVKRVLEQILLATNHALGLKNDFRVSFYEAREELRMPERIRGGPILGDYFKFTRKDIGYQLHAPPNQCLVNKPRTVRKFGLIKYGTQHLEGLNWEVMMVDSYTRNAGYLPNGRIIFYTGWFKDRGFTDGDLATILAHEVGHGLARHSSEKLIRSLWFFALVSILDKFEAANVRVKSAIIRTITAFISRRREVEADRIGMILMAAAGYDPSLAPEFYKKHGNIEINFMKSTHPTGETRAQKLNRKRVMSKARDIYNQAQAGTLGLFI